MINNARNDAKHRARSFRDALTAWLSATSDEPTLAKQLKSAHQLVDGATRELANQKADAQHHPYTIADDLLGLWTLAHAGSSSTSSAEDVNSKAWHDIVTEQLAASDPQHAHFRWYGLVNEPALFVYQTATDWEKLGLPDVEQRAAAMFAELGTSFEGAAKSAPSNSMTAVSACEHFNGREYTWNNLEDPSDREAFFEGLDGIFGDGPRKIDSATCQLTLEAPYSSCVVQRWDWTLRLREQHVQVHAWRSPGTAWQLDFNHEYYRGPLADLVLERLAALGVNAVEDDPGTIAWLQTYGSPMRLIRILDLIPDYTWFPAPPASLREPGVVYSDDPALGGACTGTDLPRRLSVGGLLYSDEIFPYDVARAMVIHRDPPHLVVQAEDTVITLDYYFYTGPR